MRAAKPAQTDSPNSAPFFVVFCLAHASSSRVGNGCTWIDQLHHTITHKRRQGPQDAIHEGSIRTQHVAAKSYAHRYSQISSVTRRLLSNTSLYQAHTDAWADWRTTHRPKPARPPSDHPHCDMRSCKQSEPDRQPKGERLVSTHERGNNSHRDITTPMECLVCATNSRP